MPGVEDEDAMNVQTTEVVNNTVSQGASGLAGVVPQSQANPAPVVAAGGAHGASARAQGAPPAGVAQGARTSSRSLAF